MNVLFRRRTILLSLGLAAAVAFSRAAALAQSSGDCLNVLVITQAKCVLQTQICAPTTCMSVTTTLDCFTTGDGAAILYQASNIKGVGWCTTNTSFTNGDTCNVCRPWVCANDSLFLSRDGNGACYNPCTKSAYSYVNSACPQP